MRLAAGKIKIKNSFDGSTILEMHQWRNSFFSKVWGCSQCVSYKSEIWVLFQRFCMHFNETSFDISSTSNYRTAAYTALNTEIPCNFLVIGPKHCGNCVSTKFPHQEIRWNYGILPSVILTLPVPCWAADTTDLHSNSNISKTVRVNIAFTRAFFKEYSKSI